MLFMNRLEVCFADFLVWRFKTTVDGPVPEFIDPVFVKTSPKRSFPVIQNERFWLVFVKTESIISGTGVSRAPSPPLAHIIQFHSALWNLLYTNHRSINSFISWLVTNVDLSQILDFQVPYGLAYGFLSQSWVGGGKSWLPFVLCLYLNLCFFTCLL